MLEHSNSLIARESVKDSPIPVNLPKLPYLVRPEEGHHEAEQNSQTLITVGTGV
jgi:hypothetical protein